MVGDSCSGCCSSCPSGGDAVSFQDLVRRAFVLQASLSFDAKEIKHQLPRSKARLVPHLKTIKTRDIPWLVGIKDALPGLLTLLSKRDKPLADAFVSENVEKVLDDELVLLRSLAEGIQSVIDGSTDVSKAMDDCDRLELISKPLFPLFARAKDALGVLKAKGAI